MNESTTSSPDAEGQSESSAATTAVLPEYPPTPEPTGPQAVSSELPQDTDSAGDPSPSQPASRTRRGGMIAAIVGGSVLALALAFSGGVLLGATAFSGSTDQTAPWGDDAVPGDQSGPQMGDQPPTGTDGERPEPPGQQSQDDDTDSDSTS